jgi:hypothetical protein
MDQPITAFADAAPPRTPDAPDFLDGFIPEEEYARIRGVTIRTCQRDRQLRKSPPYVQFGRQIFYRIDALREWLVKNEHADELTPDPRRGFGARSSRRWSGRQ